MPKNKLQDFVYTVSVQGHGKYPRTLVGDNYSITLEGIADEKEAVAFWYYINQIHEMDTFIGNLLETLGAYPEPVVVVLFGDHLPNFEISTQDLTNKDLFQTEYVIWDNLGLTRKERDVEAYQLGAYVLDMAGIQKGTMFRYHQAWLKEQEHTEEEQEKYLEKMKILEYDLLYGEQDAYEGEQPYEETELHMGVQPIEIDRIMQQGKGLYVIGWNFTSSSVLYVNGKEVETDFVSPNLLFTSDAKLKEGENQLSVGQVSEYNIILSETDPYMLRIRE